MTQAAWENTIGEFLGQVLTTLATDMTDYGGGGSLLSITAKTPATV